MDAVIFNQAIKQILTFGKNHLENSGFMLLEEPEIQEDSGDLVSTESICILYRNLTHSVDLRFFLCCGKGPLEDYLSCKIISHENPSFFVDFAELSRQVGHQLHEVDLNEAKLPMKEFLDNYFIEFNQSFEKLFELSLEKLTERAPPGAFSLTLL